MYVLAFFVGCLCGLIGSAPVAGPLSALVVTRGLQGRFRAGSYIALGGGLAEAVYAFLAFFGYAEVLKRYPAVEVVSQALAAVILVVLGLIFLKGTATKGMSKIEPRDSMVGSFLLGVSLCAFNPTLMVTWTAVVNLLAGAGLELTSGLAVPFSIGVLVGIAAWFLGLLWLIRRHREKFKPETVAKVVRGFGGMLVLLGLYIGYRFVRTMMAA